MNKNKIDLGKTPVKKIFWTYAIPSLLAMIAQSSAGLVDSIFVGRLIGPEALSAITLMMPITWLLIGIGAMIAIGGTTLAGIEYGKGNLSKSNNYFNVTILFLSISGVLAMAIMLGFRHQIADIVGAVGLVREYMLTYSGTMALFFLFFLLNFAFSFFLKLDSKPIAVVVITFSGTIINMILDYVFLAHFKMGIQGAALATGLSQLVPWLAFMVLTIKNSVWHFKMPVIRFDEVKQILFNGSSELMSNISVSITGTLFNWMIITKIGVEAIAAYAVALQVSSLAVSLGYGISEANQTGLSFNYGAKNLSRVSDLFSMTRKVNITFGVLFFILSFFMGEILARFFVTDGATIKLAVEILRVFSVSFVFVGLNISIGTYFTAMNDPVSSIVVTTLRSLVALAIGLIVLPMIFGDIGIWYSVVFAELVTLVYGLYLIKKYPYGRNANDAIEQKKLINNAA